MLFLYYYLYFMIFDMYDFFDYEKIYYVENCKGNVFKIKRILLFFN